MNTGMGPLGQAYLAQTAITVARESGPLGQAASDHANAVDMLENLADTAYRLVDRLLGRDQPPSAQGSTANTPPQPVRPFALEFQQRNVRASAAIERLSDALVMIENSL